MANISRDTFNALKKYVSVRLQQGVPLVDADWNEMEDIRKYELRAFLKWFVGDGIPEGNDGFRIKPLAGNGVNTIVLTAKTPETGSSSLVVDSTNSTAADALGFGVGNASASTEGSSLARLISTKSAPFALADGMTLTISANGQPAEKVTFQGSAFGDISAATALEVATAINSTLTHVTAAAGMDFEIAGGDGTPKGAGRCLVDGWDAINESALSYTAQRLFNKNALAKQWGVAELPPLTVPTATRTDTIYLDVWEREVDAGEDSDLVNPALGIETCVRFKREWAVRVAEGTTSLPALPPGHAFYPLARLNRQAGETAIEEEDIKDLRRTRLKIVSQNDIQRITDDVERIHNDVQQVTDDVGRIHNDVQQVTKDAYGESYTLDGDGQPNLKVSLREAINALLRGGLPATPERRLAKQAIYSGIFYPSSPSILEAPNGDIWAFCFSADLSQIWYDRYRPGTGSWQGERRLTAERTQGVNPIVLVHPSGDLWVFWQTSWGENNDIWWDRYPAETDSWQGNLKLSGENSRGRNPTALVDGSGDIWVFWYSQSPYVVWYDRYRSGTGSWQGNREITRSEGGGRYLVALLDSSRNPWVVCQCRTVIIEQDKQRYVDAIRCLRYLPATDQWQSFTVTQVGDQPGTAGDSIGDFTALVDRNGDLWIFWYSYGPLGQPTNNYDIWCDRYYSATDSWEGNWQLTDDAANDYLSTALVDGSGDIWVFWTSSRASDAGGNNQDIWYRCHRQSNDYWEGETRLTTDEGNDERPFVLEAQNGDLWVFWHSIKGSNYSAWYKRYTREFGWDRSVQLAATSALELGIYPFALEDRSGDLWVFWISLLFEEWGQRIEIWYRQLFVQI